MKLVPGLCCDVEAAVAKFVVRGIFDCGTGNGRYSRSTSEGAAAVVNRQAVWTPTGAATC